jgi:hypothetical protein
LDRSQNKFFIKDEVVSEKTHVENLFCVTFQSPTVESKGLDCTLKCPYNYFLLISLQSSDNLQKFINVIGINDKGNGYVFRLQFGLGFLVLIKQLRYKRWKLIVDVGHNNIDHFFEDSV